MVILCVLIHIKIQIYQFRTCKSFGAQTIINNKRILEKIFQLINNYYNERKSYSKFQFIKDDFNKYFNGMENLEFKSSFYVVRCTKK